MPNPIKFPIISRTFFDCIWISDLTYAIYIMNGLSKDTILLIKT